MKSSLILTTVQQTFSPIIYALLVFGRGPLPFEMMNHTFAGVRKLSAARGPKRELNSQNLLWKAAELRRAGASAGARGWKKGNAVTRLFTSFSSGCMFLPNAVTCIMHAVAVLGTAYNGSFRKGYSLRG